MVIRPLEVTFRLTGRLEEEHKKDEHVEWIWQLNRKGDSACWSYDRNNAQRRIPGRPIQNLAKPEMLYTAQ